jgi:hypothetical protein
MKSRARAEMVAADVRKLHRLGHPRRLLRDMGDLSNFAISFSIIWILTGALLLYAYGLRFAGPMASILTVIIAEPVTEVASPYPIAG